MWVEELKNGKYKFVERYTDPMTGKSKRVAVVMDKNTARNRKMAALTLSGKIESALAPQADRIRLKDLVELYRKEQVKTLKQSTYRRNIAVCNTLMSILGKDIYVDKLTAGYSMHINRYKLLRNIAFLGTFNVETVQQNTIFCPMKAPRKWYNINVPESNALGCFYQRLEQLESIDQNSKCTSISILSPTSFIVILP